MRPNSITKTMLNLCLKAIASGDADSMQSFGHHTIAAARCIEFRGPTQFHSEASVKLFLQMRRIIVSICITSIPTLRTLTLRRS